MGVSVNGRAMAQYSNWKEVWLFPFPYYQMVPWLQWPEGFILYLCHAYLHVGSVCKYTIT